MTSADEDWAYGRSWRTGDVVGTDLWIISDGPDGGEIVALPLKALPAGIVPPKPGSIIFIEHDDAHLRPPTPQVKAPPRYAAHPSLVVRKGLIVKRRSFLSRIAGVVGRALADLAEGFTSCSSAQTQRMELLALPLLSS